jgi:hypothetical protein
MPHVPTVGTRRQKFSLTSKCIPWGLLVAQPLVYYPWTTCRHQGFITVREKGQCKGNPLTPAVSSIANTSAVTPHASATLTPVAHCGAPAAHLRHIAAHYRCHPVFHPFPPFLILS